MRAPSHHRYTWEHYVVLERDSPIKHEFLDGEIFAMAGDPPEHTALGAAVLRELGVQLKGKPCRPYSSDLSIRVEASGLTTYPDASVVCGEPRHDPVAKKGTWMLFMQIFSSNLNRCPLFTRTVQAVAPAR